MSIAAALQNNNRVVRATVVTPPSQASGTTIFVTISGFRSFAKLKKVTISASNSIVTPTVTVLTDAAAYRNASGAAKSPFIQAQVASVATGTFHNIPFSDDYVSDPTRTGKLCLLITAGSAITTGTVLTVTVEGVPCLPATIGEIDTPLSQYSGDRTWRVLVAPSGGTVANVTQQLRQNGRPLDATVIGLSGTSDYIYFGAASLPKLVEVGILSGAQGANSALTLEIWTGSAWATPNAWGDNTSDGQASPSTMSYNGWLSIVDAAWAKHVLTTDPAYQIQTDIDAGNTFALDMFTNPALYWARFKVSGLSGTLLLSKLVPLSYPGCPSSGF